MVQNYPIVTYIRIKNGPKLFNRIKILGSSKTSGSSLCANLQVLNLREGQFLFTGLHPGCTLSEALVNIIEN